MLAIEAGLSIVPLSIVGTRHVMRKGRLTVAPGDVTLAVHPPIDAAARAEHGGRRWRIQAAARAGRGADTAGGECGALGAGAQDGGVLMRAGHTEAGCDFAAMAGLIPAAVICEIMNDDGSMARLPDLERFADTHRMKIGTIADLIAFRSHSESLIERQGERDITTPAGMFRCVVFRDRGHGLHLALVKGHWVGKDDVLVRVHEPFTAIDLLDVGSSRHSWPLQAALQRLQRAPASVAVLLNCSHDLTTLLPQLQPAKVRAEPAGTSAAALRTYGIGAQILRDLGVGRMRLLGSPRRMPSMTGYGLEVTGFEAPTD